MKLIQLEQGSPEWHAWRSNGIGASEAATILEESPWETPLQLWERKLNLAPPPSKNHAMRRGSELEPFIRRRYVEKTGRSIFPVTIESSEHSVMRASLDGYNAVDRRVVEIKYMGATNFIDLKRSDTLPTHYFCQVQHQMYCAETSSMDFTAYNDEIDEMHIVHVFRDDYFIDKMVKSELEFWRLVETFTEPKATARDIVKVDDVLLQSVAQNYQTIDAQIKLLTEKRDELKQTLLSEMYHPRTQIDNLLITRSKRRGSIDYSKIPELKGVDLNKYRKAPSEMVRITIKKN